MKIVNFDGENLHILWSTWGISIKCLGKIYGNIKSLKKPGLHHLSRRYIFGRTTGVEEAHLSPIPPPTPHTHTQTQTHIRTSSPCLLIVKMNPGFIHLQKGFQRYKTFPRSSMHSPSLNLFRNLFEIYELECLNSAFF